MATLSNPAITVIPPEALGDVEFPMLDPINTFDLVGPVAANRQPTALKTRDVTLRQRVNQLIANMNDISTGEGSAVLFLPRDGTNPMTGALVMGANRITGLAAGTVDSDAIRKDQVVENRLWATPTSAPDAYVQVSAGTYQKLDGKGFKTVGAQSVQITTSVGGGQSRFDLVHIDDEGALGVTQGTPDTPGTVPEFPSDKLMLAVVEVDETGAIVVDTADITDVRPFLSADQNARRIQDRPVDAAAPATDNALVWDGTKWSPGLADAKELQGRTVSAAGPAVDNALVWNGSQWNPGLADAKELQGRLIDSAAPTTGDALIWDGSKYAPETPGLPTNFIGGLITSNNSTQPNDDIDIAPGKCRDDADTASLTLSSVLTKQIDAGWSAGNDAGGLDVGNVFATMLYAIWLIKDTDGTVDALFSLSFTSPTMPGTYDKKRLIAAVRTDVSKNILAYTQSGDHFRYMSRIQELDDSSIVTNVFETLTFGAVPPSCIADIYGFFENPGTTDEFLRFRIRAKGADEGNSWMNIEPGIAPNRLSMAGRVFADSNQQIEYGAQFVNVSSPRIVIDSFGFTMLTRREP